MKRIPQFELPIANEPLALITETAVDGDRVVQASAARAADQAAAAANQHPLFGDVIYAYTRAQAIADGVLVDVMQAETAPLVREAGFKYPVAMTIGAWTATIGEPDQPLPAGQDLQGRLWDVLWMLKVAISRTAGTDRVAFTVLVSGRRVKLWSLCGPGDDASPVITIMLEGED